MRGRSDGARGRPGLSLVCLPALLALATGCGEEFSEQPGGGAGPLPPTDPFSLSAGSAADQRALGVAVDDEGNIAVTGHFEGELDLGGDLLTSAGSTGSYADIFLGRFDPNGTHLWSKRFGGTGIDRGMSIAVDSDGNIVLGASFAGLLEFDGEPLQARGYDILIAKLSPTGEHIWHRVFGEAGEEGSGYDEPWSIALDAEDNILVVGRFSGSLVLAEEHYADPEELNRYDAFVAKLDPQGEPLWSLAFGGDHDDVARRVAVTPTGEVAVTGNFSGLAMVGDLTWATPDSGSAAPNAFVLRLTADGQVDWGKNLGDEAYQYGFGIGIDHAGTTYATGGFAGSVNFDGALRTTHGGSDVYLASYGSDGGLRWAWHAGGSLADVGGQVACNPDGTLTLGGGFAGSLEFGTDVLHAEDEQDLFLARLSTDAHPLWSRAFSGTALDAMTGMVVDAAGNTIMVGYFEGTLDFGQGVLSSHDGEDLFIAKIAP